MNVSICQYLLNFTLKIHLTHYAWIISQWKGSQGEKKWYGEVGSLVKEVCTLFLSVPIFPLGKSVMHKDIKVWWMLQEDLRLALLIQCDTDIRKGNRQSWDQKWIFVFYPIDSWQWCQGNSVRQRIVFPTICARKIGYPCAKHKFQRLLHTRNNNKKNNSKFIIGLNVKR